MIRYSAPGILLAVILKFVRENTEYSGLADMTTPLAKQVVFQVEIMIYFLKKYLRVSTKF
jgi:hypothetical protein